MRTTLQRKRFLLLCIATSHGYLQSSSFLGTPQPVAFFVENGDTLTMRKQKASDKRTRRRQQGLEDDPAAGLPTTITESPMRRGVWKGKRNAFPVPEDSPRRGGRQRSQKRRNLYSALSKYHMSFLKALTEEFRVEVRVYCPFWSCLSHPTVGTRGVATH